MPRPALNRLPVLVVAGLLLVGIAVPMSGGELGFGGTASVAPGRRRRSRAVPVAIATGSPTAAPTASRHG